MPQQGATMLLQCATMPHEKKQERRWHPWRFSLRTLLMVPLVVGGIVTWTAWPDRTFNRFQQLVRNGNIDEACDMMRFGDGCTFAVGVRGPGLSFIIDNTTLSWVQLSGTTIGMVQLDPRSLNDVVMARRHFSLQNFELTVQRGVILVESSGTISPLSPVGKRSPVRSER